MTALAALIAAPGCREQAREKANASAKEVAAAPQQQSGRKEGAAVAVAVPTTVVAATPAPAPVAKKPSPARANGPIILGKRDVVVAGKSSCEISVQYPGEDPRSVTWNGEGCGAVSASIMDAARIDVLGHPERLNEENRDDITRIGGALYVEGEASSALYPLNVFKRTYQIPLAD